MPPNPRRPASDEDTTVYENPSRANREASGEHQPPPDLLSAIAENNRLMRTLVKETNELKSDIHGIKTQLATGALQLKRAEDLETKVQVLERTVLVLETRFAIVWAGLGVIATTAIGAAITAIMAIRATP